MIAMRNRGACDDRRPQRVAAAVQINVLSIEKLRDKVVTSSMGRYEPARQRGDTS
jgi:hypothetical protein